MRLALFYFIIAIFSVQQVVPLPFRIDAADNVGMYDYTFFQNVFHYSFFIFYFYLEIHALQLALELENLEKEFYTLGLNQFNENDFAEAGFSAQVFQRFQEIKEHEEAHAESLAAILGPAAPQPCNYSLYVSILFFCGGMGFYKRRVKQFSLSIAHSTMFQLLSILA